MSKIYGYIRASTAHQVASPDTQREMIQEYVSRLKGRPEVDEFFIDPAISGKKAIFDRPAGRELMLIMKPGDSVVCVRLDRLSRSLINFVQILESWTERGIILHVMDMPGGVYDASNPMMRMLIHMLVVIAEFERALNSQRVKEAWAVRKATGAMYKAGPKYGFKMIKRHNRRLGKSTWFAVPDDEERSIMGRILALKTEGNSEEQIAYILNRKLKVQRRGREWTQQQVSRAIHGALHIMAAPPEEPDGLNLNGNAIPESQLGDLTV